MKPEWRVKIAAREEKIKRVPQFMYFHDELQLPQEAIDQIIRDTKGAKADEFGVRQVELFHNPDGKVYCLLEAPDAEAAQPPRRPRRALWRRPRGVGTALRFPARGESNGDDHCLINRDVTARTVYSEPA